MVFKVKKLKAMSFIAFNYQTLINYRLLEAPLLLVR